MIKKALYNLLEKDFARYQRESKNLSESHSELEYRFTDDNKKQWFGFPESLAMSHERFGALTDFLAWFSSGITGKVLDDLIGIANEALEGGIVALDGNKRVNAIKIGAALSEIQERRKSVIPVELVLNVVAVQLVREDENPKLFNNKIHREKVDFLLKESQKENTFFLSIPEFTKLKGSTITSEDEWMQYLESQAQEMKIINKRIETLKNYESSK